MYIKHSKPYRQGKELIDEKKLTEFVNFRFVYHIGLKLFSVYAVLCQSQDTPFWGGGGSYSSAQEKSWIILIVIWYKDLTGHFNINFYMIRYLWISFAMWNWFRVDLVDGIRIMGTFLAISTGNLFFYIIYTTLQLSLLSFTLSKPNQTPKQVSNTLM